MKRKRDFIFITGYAMRIIHSIKTKVLIGCMKWERLIMHIGCYTTFCHLHDDLSSFSIADRLTILLEYSGDVEMSAACVFVGIMVQNFNSQRLKSSIVLADDFFSSCKHSRIALELSLILHLYHGPTISYSHAPSLSLARASLLCP